MWLLPLASSPLFSSVIRFCVFLSLVATICRAAPAGNIEKLVRLFEASGRPIPPPFSYSELPRSFASAAHRANLANADQAGRFVSNQSPRTNAGSTTVPANEDLRTGNTLGISSVEYQGHSIWRVMPQYVPYSDTAEVQWQGDVQRFPEGLTAAIQKENDGLRLINKGNTGRIFKMGNDYRAYYVPGESSVLLHYAAVDNSGFMHVSIHKIPENQIIKTGAFDR